MTEKHLLFSDPQFEEKFATSSLPPSLFTHEAHLRLAFIHIKKYGVTKAISNMCQQIENFEKAYGENSKFNKTVTVASVKVLHYFISKSKARTYRSLIRQYPKLKYNFLSLIREHYKLNIFKSKIAKRKYIEPDLMPFG